MLREAETFLFTPSLVSHLQEAAVASAKDVDPRYAQLATVCKTLALSASTTLKHLHATIALDLI
jgi:hypothetical protein